MSEAASHNTREPLMPGAQNLGRPTSFPLLPRPGSPKPWMVWISTYFLARSWDLVGRIRLRTVTRNRVEHSEADSGSAGKDCRRLD